MFAFLALVTLCGYGLHLTLYLRGDGKGRLSLWTLAGVLAIHLLLLLPDLLTGRFGFFSTFSLASWMCNLLVLFIPGLRFVSPWFVSVALIAVALDANLNNMYGLDKNNQVAVLLHAAIAIFGLAICSLLTIVLGYRKIRAAQLKRLNRRQWESSPALESIDRISHRLLYAAVAVIGTGLATGVVFIDDVFARSTAHKTLFSMTAWLILLAACVLHTTARAGWGKIFWYVSTASTLLASGYFGSRFIQEFLLADGT